MCVFVCMYRVLVLYGGFDGWVVQYVQGTEVYEACCVVLMGGWCSMYKKQKYMKLVVWF